MATFDNSRLAKWLKNQELSDSWKPEVGTVDDVESNKLYKDYLSRKSQNRDLEFQAKIRDLRENPPLPGVPHDRDLSEFDMENVIDGQPIQPKMPISSQTIPYRPLDNYSDSSVSENINSDLLSSIGNKIKEKVISPTAVQNPAHISESEKEGIKKTIDSPQIDPNKRTKETITDILNGQEKPKSAGDQFLDALAYFAPTIVAGIGGALIGGAEAGSMAAKSTTELNKGWLDYRQKASGELDPYKKASLLLRAREADIAEKSLENRVTATSGLNDYRKTREERLREQFAADLPFKEIRAKTAQDRVSLAKLKASGFSDKQVESVSSATNAMDEVRQSLDILESNPKVKSEIGPLAGNLSNIKQVFGANSKEYTELMGKVKYFKSDVFHEKFGTAISKQEMALLANVLPSETDTPKKFVEKLANFENQLNDKLRNNLEKIKKLQPTKAATADQLLQNTDNRKPTKEEIEAEKARRARK